MLKGLIFYIWLCVTTLMFLPHIVGATSSSANSSTWNDKEDEDWSLVKDIDRLSSSRMSRKLQALCDDGSRPVIHYFEVLVRIQPDSSVTGICTLADQMKLGSDINKILSSHAIGDSGIYQTVKFKAAVCTLPIQSTRRSLQLATFQWKGGGGCRGCPCDCRDGRRELQFAVWGTTDWFNTVYAPQLESSLLHAIRTTVVPNHLKCLGTNPLVTVEINKITLTQLISRFQCQAGRLISLLETMSLSNIAVIDRMCDNCVSIDFSKASDGTLLQGGMDISQQWQQDGLTIQASSLITSLLTTAKVLDTGNQMCLDLTLAREYGSPNQSCPKGGGIGRGNGGAVGTEGENCSPLGNVLILQDPFFSHTCPRPSFMGGRLSFTFQTPVYFHDLGVLDMDEFASRLEITYSDDVVEYFNFIRFGDNAVQRVIVSKPNVKKMELVFYLGTSAVTEISYCRVCEAKEGHDESHSCSVAGNVVNKMSEVIEVNNFEEPNILDALKGWENGRIYSGLESVVFTKFLGSFTASDMAVAAPYKVFSVPNDAETIVVELDFYEIDQWNQDSMAIFVNGEQILMQFTHSQDEGKQEGRTQLGVHWTSVSMDIPKPLGFSSSALDQKHHITIEVPSTSQLYKDGQLRIKLWWGSTNPSSMAFAGWDNIQVSVRHGCSLLGTTPQTSSPTSQPPKNPTNKPSMIPTNLPTKIPTNLPTILPTSPTVSRPKRGPTTGRLP